jgi:hypothetical protein
MNALTLALAALSAVAQMAVTDTDGTVDADELKAAADAGLLPA